MKQWLRGQTLNYWVPRSIPGSVAGFRTDHVCVVSAAKRQSTKSAVGDTRGSLEWVPQQGVESRKMEERSESQMGKSDKLKSEQQRNKEKI